MRHIAILVLALACEMPGSATGAAESSAVADRRAPAEPSPAPAEGASPRPNATKPASTPAPAATSSAATPAVVVPPPSPSPTEVQEPDPVAAAARPADDAPLHERLCAKLDACGCAGTNCIERWTTDGSESPATKFMRCALELDCAQMCGDMNDKSTPIGRCRDRATAPARPRSVGGGGSGGGPGASCNYGVVPSGCRMPYVCLRCPRANGLGTRAKCVLGGC